LDIGFEHALAAKAPVEVVQNNLGHASLGTTTTYLTTEKSRRHREMRKFWREGAKDGAQIE
jgi:integrase